MIENEIETYHVYREPGGGILIRKEEEPVIDSTPVRQPRDNHTLVLIIACSFVMLFFAVFTPASPISAQVTLVHKFTIPNDIQSFTLAPVTRSETRTVITTGRGHTPATVARGFLTFFNGSFAPQDIPQNMIFTTASGTQIVTDSPVMVPAGNPPNYGQISVPSHALSAGEMGNIPAYAIDTACCFSAVKAINESAFVGGRDARDFHTVTKQDIKAPALQPLYALTPDAVLIAGTCSTKVTANHRPGEEAASVKVTAFETCTGSAFSKKTLAARAQQLVRIPRDFRVTSLSVNVVATTKTAAVVRIMYTTLYDFSKEGMEK